MTLYDSSKVLATVARLSLTGPFGKIVAVPADLPIGSLLLVLPHKRGVNQGQDLVDL